MKIETEKKSTTTTTTTSRRTSSMSSPNAVQRTTRIKKTGVNAIKDRVQELEIRSRNNVQVAHKSKKVEIITSEKDISNKSLIVRDDDQSQKKDEFLLLEESCNSDSNVPNTNYVNQIEECSNGDSNARSCDVEVNLIISDSDQRQEIDLDKSEDQVGEIKLVKEKEKQEEDLSSEAKNVCETEKVAQEEEKVVVDSNSEDINNGGEFEREKNMINGKNDKELIGKSDRNDGSDQLIELKSNQIKSKKIVSSSVNGGRNVRKPPSSSSLPSTSREGQYVHDHSSRSPETHGKLQFLVDIVMWRDVSRSAFIFGIGTFSIISSSFTKDLNFSLISVASYLTLVYLAVVFLCKSFVKRGIVDDGVVPESESYIWGEDEAIWLAKMVLPYLNESLINLRVLFSGEPAITLKVALVLFILARCGSCITVWTMLKLSFFGVFIIPKFCSSYSNQLVVYGSFWMKRFQDAWTSCSHKKALAFVVFMLVWKFSSVVARAWAAFMLFVAFRCYHQYSIPQENFNDEQIGVHNVRLRRQSTRHTYKVSTSTPLNKMKEKKSF